MFGPFVRRGGLAVAGFILASGLKEILDVVIPEIEVGLNPNHQLVTGLKSVNEWFAFIIFGMLLIGLIGRAVVESKVNGGRF